VPPRESVVTTSTHIPLSEDAALVTALAGTAMAFSHCAEDEAERWLRALRLHGEVGCVLQALGVGEAPLETLADDLCDTEESTPPLGDAALGQAVRGAEAQAVARGASKVGTTDLLMALLDVYGEGMDRALRLRGSSRSEVLERLGSGGLQSAQQ
jgi:hypothetical protein